MCGGNACEEKNTTMTEKDHKKAIARRSAERILALSLTTYYCSLLSSLFTIGGYTLRRGKSYGNACMAIMI